MKGQKITSVSPLEGALNFVGSLASSLGSVQSKDRFNTQVGNIEVDTCYAADTGVWETGIKRPNIEGAWIIVSQYENRGEAQIKHEGWVKLMTDNPKVKLRDIDMWNLGLNEEEN